MDGLTAPLDLGDATLPPELRRVLDGAGYDRDGLGRLLGVDAKGERRDLPVYDRRLGRGRLETLVRLFWMGVEVAEGEASAALEPLPLARLESSGLLLREGGRVRCDLALSLFDDLLLIHDRSAPGGQLRTDHVLSPGPASRTLALLTVRRRVRTALDLGTGCGVQALLTSPFAERVVATDVNTRALNLARFNAALNGATNIEFLQGSFFEPVAERRFDLVVTNPPFVISPDTDVLFRDSGLEGDAVCAMIVRTLPKHLTEGGFACMLAHWVHRRDEHWAAPVREWIGDRGCDVWLLHHSDCDPLTYAADWTRSADPDTFGEALDRWTAYHERIGVRSISAGAIVMRRRRGDNWLREDETPQSSLAEGFTEQAQAVFAAQDYLAAASDEDMSEGTFAVVEGSAIEQSAVWKGRALVAGMTRLRSGRGLPFELTLDSGALDLLTRCDGTRPLRRIASELGGGDDPEALAQAVAVARRLVALGLLLPADERGRSPSGH